MKKCYFWAAASLLLLASPAAAQSIFATLVGTVTDKTSAVVSGARVTVTNVNTNEKREFVTSPAGSYELNNLFPGSYVLEVHLAGFARYRRESISLASNENARIDVSLEVTAQLTEVTVTADGGVRIDTESSVLSDVRSFRQLSSLPLATRSIYRYLVLTPGVVGGKDGTMSVSGSRGRQVHYAVDGVTMSDVRSSNTIGPTLNFNEAFEEFKIDFGNNSAEFKALGTLNVTTKRGGNRVHGAVADYYSTGRFRARDYFTRSRNTTPSHGFGAFVSGPVYVPKLYDGRDKTFWFISYETTFAPQDVSNLTPSVPLPAWKRGDFSGETAVIRDPFANNTPFAGKIIPASRINSTARVYLPLWPDPNFGDINVFANQNYREQKRRPFAKPHNVQVRFDHRISTKNTIFGRHLHQRQQNPDFESGIPGQFGLRQQLRVVKHSLISDTHVFSPTFINEFRFGISYNTNPRWAKDVNGKDFLTRTGLQNVTRDGNIPEAFVVPIVSFAQGPAVRTIEVTQQRYFNEDLTYQWQDTVSKIIGKHSLRFGFEVNQRYFNDQNQPTNLYGSFQFTNRFTGFNFADFLLGVPTSASRGAFALKREDTSIAYDWFIQDTYKVTPTLTLNLGLRYELHPAWTTNGNRISAFDSRTGSIVVPDSALPLVSDLFPTNLVPVIGHSKTAYNDRLFNTDKNNLAPRVGFAWRAFGSKTFVIRAAYGLFYDIIPRQTSLFGTPFIVNEPGHTNPTDIRDPLFIQWPIAFPRVNRGAGVSLPSSWEIGFRTPYAQNWNLTLEKEVPFDMKVRASYIGTGGRQMAYAFNINQPLPGPGLFVDKPRAFPSLPAITEQRNGASHTYHSLNLELERRFAQGLLFETSFTLAKDLGDEDVTPENTFDRSRERARTVVTPFRRWVGFVIYEFPFGAGKPLLNQSRFARQLAGGWELSASATLQDGQMETPRWQTSDIHGIAFTASRTPANVAYRPDCTDNPNFPDNRRTIDAWYDVNAFRLPTTPGVFGNCGRSIVEGPGVRVLHAGVFKRFTFAERYSARIGLQAVNAFNHPNWSNIGGNAMRLDGIGARARVTAAGGATSGSAGDAPGARVLRLDLRIEF